MFFADERNQDSLIAFLKSILKLPDDEYYEINILDPHLLPEYIKDKAAVIDVKLRTKSGKIVHIEIQLKIMAEMRERIVFYDARMITEQLEKSDRYSKINQVISIIITRDRLIKNSANYSHRFTLYDIDAKIEFSDIIEIHTLELSKVPETADGTKLYDWAKFIDAENEEELSMIAERNPQVKNAAVKLIELSSDEKARDQAERREKALRDLDARERYIRAEERELWQGVVADKDATLADKDAEIADKDAEIARLRALLEKTQETSL